MLRDLLNRFRKRTPTLLGTVSVEDLRKLYDILKVLRVSLVESFDMIKDRRLRDVYDVFSYMMLHYDKLCQFLRRIVDAPLYEDLQNRRYSIDEMISSLPVELALRVRNLASYVRALQSYAATASPNAIRGIILDISEAVDDIANIINSVLR